MYTSNPLRNPDKPTRPSFKRRPYWEFRLHVGLLTADKTKTYHPDFVMKLIQEFKPWQGRRVTARTKRLLYGATVWVGWGVYEGDLEPTMVISTYYLDDDVATFREYLLQLAAWLGEKLEQSEVLVVEFDFTASAFVKRRTKRQRAYDRWKTRRALRPRQLPRRRISRR